MLGLLAATGACASGTHRSALSGAPELCAPPPIQTVVSSKLASGTTYVYGPISNVGVVVGSPVAGETLTGVRIDVVADPLTTAAVPNPSTSAGVAAEQSAAQAQIDVSLGTEKGVVARKVFAAPTAGEHLLVPLAAAASARTALAPGHYIAWEVDTYTCSLDTGSPEAKGSREVLADITISYWLDAPPGAAPRGKQARKNDHVRGRCVRIESRSRAFVCPLWHSLTS